MKFVSLALLLAILFLGCSPAFADNIAIQNASFETTNPLTTSCGPACLYNSGPIPGWTTSASGTLQGSWQPGPVQFTSLSNGSMAAYSNGGTISQILSDSLLANNLYTLTVAVGNRADTAIYNLATTYIIQLFAGSTLLNSITGSNAVIPLGTFMDVSFNYLSGVTFPAGNLSIVLSSIGPQSDFDNVRLTATSTVTSVAEPGSLTLLAAGLGLALFVFRRR